MTQNKNKTVLSRHQPHRRNVVLKYCLDKQLETDYTWRRMKRQYWPQPNGCDQTETGKVKEIGNTTLVNITAHFD